MSPPVRSSGVRPALLGAVAFALALVAGYALTPPASADEDALAALRAEEAADPSRAPAWNVGDAWRVRFRDGAPVCFMVVTRADAAGYQQGVSCATDESEFIAVQIAALGLPYLGNFSLDLEGRAASDETRWYDWPLEPGKTWRTVFDGEDVLVSAREVGGRMAMTMEDASGEQVAAYDYDPELRWWSTLALEAFTLRVLERETAWEGRVFAAEGRSVADTPSNFVMGATASFTARQEDDSIVVMLSRPPMSVEYYELTGPDGAEAHNGLAMPVLVTDSWEFDIFDASPGGWTLRQAGAGAGAFSMRASTVQVETVEL
jgi:hypothetical protein